MNNHKPPAEFHLTIRVIIIQKMAQVQTVQFDITFCACYFRLSTVLWQLSLMTLFTYKQKPALKFTSDVYHLGPPLHVKPATLFTLFKQCTGFFAWLVGPHLETSHYMLQLPVETIFLQSGSQQKMSPLFCKFLFTFK